MKSGFYILLLLLLIPATSFGKAEKSKKCSLERVALLANVFATRSSRMIYIEDQEYVRASLGKITNHVIIRYKKLEENKVISHLKYLEGDQKVGRTAAGGIPIYKDIYPFDQKQVKRYEFFCQAETVTAVPLANEQDLYVMKLTLKEGYPDHLFMSPAVMFPNLEYYAKEVFFTRQEGALLESYIEISGAFYYLPFYRSVSRYRVKRHSYQLKNLAWNNK